MTDGEYKKLRWHEVILVQWMSNIMRQDIRYHVKHPDNFWINRTQTIVYKDNIEFRNILFADTLEVIANVILSNMANYFLRFSNEYKKVPGVEKFDNNWYEYVECGTINLATIMLQRIRFMRENSTYIRNNKEKYIIQENDDKFLLSIERLTFGNQNVRDQANTILLNVPEMFELEIK